MQEDGQGDGRREGDDGSCFSDGCCLCLLDRCVVVSITRACSHLLGEIVNWTKGIGGEVIPTDWTLHQL